MKQLRSPWSQNFTPLVSLMSPYDRKHGPDLGNQITWHGQTRLTSAALGHVIGYCDGFADGQEHALRTQYWPVVMQSYGYPVGLANALSPLYSLGSREKRLFDAMLLAAPKSLHGDRIERRPRRW